MKSKWMKKLFSIFLAVLMACSTVTPIVANADGFQKGKTITLNQYYRYKNGNWKKSGTVTITSTSFWSGSVWGGKGTITFSKGCKFRLGIWCDKYGEFKEDFLGGTKKFYYSTNHDWNKIYLYKSSKRNGFYVTATTSFRDGKDTVESLDSISDFTLQKGYTDQNHLPYYELDKEYQVYIGKSKPTIISTSYYQTYSANYESTTSYKASSSTGETANIPINTRLVATQYSSDGKKALVTYRGKQYWVNLEYFRYIEPIITKPDPPTVTLKSAEDIKLGDLITVEWNTPSDAKYFSAVLKDLSGNQVERYDNVYGNATSFQSQKAGKYTVEVIAHNSEYSSEPGKLGKTITVHDFVNVTFKDEDGTELGTQKIPWGDNAVSLIAPEKKGHSFKGWSGSLYNVKNDITVTAQYDKANYTVEFIGYQADEKGIPNKEVLLKKETVEYGADATAPIDDEIVVPKNYEFMGWSSEEYKNVYTPYKNEPIKIYAVYGWKNKDLPISCEITSAVRQANGYYVYYNLENYPDAITRGRVIVALKTSEGKLIDMTESSAFSLEKGETETGARIFIPCEKAATTAEIFIVNGYTNNGMSDGIPISNKDSSTVVEGKMWSDWGTTPIADNGDNEVESRTEYSFRNIRETTGNTSVKPDWVTLMKDNVIKHGDEYQERLTNTSYIDSYKNAKRTDNSASVAWSGWSWNQVSGFDTESKRRDVGTQSAIKSYNYKTMYDYYRWAANYTGGYSSAWQTNNHPNSYSYSFDYALSSYGTTSQGVEGFKYWYSSSNYIVVYKCSQPTHQVQTSANYGTQYRYKDSTYTYYFYRWDDKDWSSWSADKVTATDKREVQTRTVYREKSVSAGIEDVTGEMRTFSGSVDPEFAGKNITFFVSKYNAISDFTDEYVAQSTIGEDGSYTFNYKLREEPTAETGDFTIMIGIEGTTEKQVVGTIEAPKPVYTVKFYGDSKDNNPEVIYEASVRQGETADFPEENPEIAGKRFICWNNSCTNVQSDMDVYPVLEDEEYTVIFVDWRKQTIETQKYKYGEALVPPTSEVDVVNENEEVVDTIDVEVTDVDSGYGRGWDYEEGSLVTSDMVIQAVYDTKTYDVTFHDYDGSVIDTQTVEYDGVAEAPELADEESDGIEYHDWDIDVEELYGVKENIDVFPAYEFDETTPNPTASVETGAYDGTQTVTLGCEDENAVIYYTTDGTEPQEGFNGVEYTAPITVDSKTELKFYASSMGKNDSEVVTECYVINNDGVIINMHDNIYGDEGIETYLVASMADFDDSLMDFSGYTLDGVYSDNEYVNPVVFNNENATKGMIDLYAKYSINSYNVTFAYDDGTIIDEQTVNYSESAVEPNVADKGTLKFIGWDNDKWDCVTEDVTVHPMFKEESEIIYVTFDKVKYQMELDSTYQINATIITPDSEKYEDLNDAVLWYSDNEDVATVDNTGLVTALKSGTAKIYAVTVDEINVAECEITVAPSVNNSILINNLSALDVDSEGYLRRIPLDGTNTVDNISANFLNSSEQLTFTNSKGNVISGNNLVGTNTVISLMNGEKVIDSMAVIMTGDVTCDGAVNNRDVAYAARVIVKRNTADAGQLRAMDVNGDGKVNNRDVAMLSRYLVGKETINN